MNPAYPANVDVVYVEQEHRFLHDMRAALTHNGYSGIRECSTVSSAEGAILTTPPDILVLDAHFAHDGAFNLIHRLRHNELGSNPFLCVVATINVPDRRLVGRLMKSGVDFLMVKPLSPSGVVQRFRALAVNARPFAVTSSYIGPEHADHNEIVGGEARTLIEVPNTVALKSQGVQLEPYDLQVRVHRAMGEIDAARVRHDAHAINRLVRRIISQIESDDPKRQLWPDASRLRETVIDLRERLPQSDPVHVRELCASLADLTIRVVQRPRQVDSKTLGLLLSISEAVVQCFVSETEADAFAEEVVGMVREMSG